MDRTARVAPTKGGKDSITIAGPDSITSIPSRAGSHIRLTKTGRTMGITIPGHDDIPAKTVGQGVVVFDYKNGSATAPVVLSDGSVQITTIISAANAPRSYTYQLDLPDGATATEMGGRLWFSVGTQPLGGIAPAWATDSNGASVPTRYVYKEGILTQIVDHSAKFAYPIVADPWIGINLFSSITVDSYYSQPRVNLNLSWWGWAIYTGNAQGAGILGVAAGQAILNSAGWTEAWTKNSTVQAALNKTSQRQQFECHALGALLVGTWNLEKYRPTLNVWWGNNVAQHHCNWSTPSGGI